MKHIVKGKKPDSLQNYLYKNNNCKYEDLRSDVKKDLRKALLEEQGYICCYCMQRIKNNEKTTKIEHWKPQKKYPDLQLDYKNLLAACKGNEGNEGKKQHCDTKKSDKEITINPTHEKCELNIKYRGDGEIFSDDLVIDNELNDILNLNMQTLRDNREAVIEIVRENITKIKGNDSAWPSNEIKKIIQKYKKKDDGKFKPYCQAVIYLLEKRISLHYPCAL
ncbi:MAG: TIGR02646 family protein [Candidatus Cloacimonetes bacterium 4572_55]|nr:MAG: TIGR02646 family protein [Candidatus Cloacimonetes bacterium 4572_55]